ncbi:hypothetical protein [Stutzerimonas nitrititolerans]|uniref:hypothetical protein n=1 Tax=Stutzerimonas nitrititolerans TaxID=2482751 RepID=UPI0028AC68E0|nr:hypothetical protein [Stutzerimonas nitrititolerans]
MDREVIFSPPVLSFFGDHYQEFFSFIRHIEDAAANGNVLIDITSVREVKAAALLVLYSTVEIAQVKSKQRKRIQFTFATYQGVVQSFSKFGLWALTDQLRTMPASSDVNSLDICTASREATTAGDDSELRRVLEYAQNKVLQGSDNEEADLLAYNAITESVSNVWQHAYDDDFFDGGVEPELAHWWIIVECIDDQFYIAVYDKGAGIPFTLQKKSWYHVAFVNEQGKIEFEIPVDAQRIKMAVEYGRSRFKVDNRGKGLSEAKDFVQSNPDGTLIIYSGFGNYTYHSEDGKEELRKLPSTFGGTLIQWNLRLNKK